MTDPAAETVILNNGNNSGMALVQLETEGSILISAHVTLPEDCAFTAQPCLHEPISDEIEEISSGQSMRTQDAIPAS